MMNAAAPETAQQPATPSLLRRLAAIVYDSIVVAGLVLLVSGLIIIPLGMNAGPEQWESMQNAFWIRLAIQLACLLVIIGFHVGFWSHGGQTLGMRAWRLKVENADGQAIGLIDALKRYALAWLSALPFGLGFLRSLWHPQGLTWHDEFSSTRLRLLPKNK